MSWWPYSARICPREQAPQVFAIYDSTGIAYFRICFLERVIGLPPPLHALQIFLILYTPAFLPETKVPYFSSSISLLLRLPSRFSIRSF